LKGKLPRSKTKYIEKKAKDTFYGLNHKINILLLPFFDLGRQGDRINSTFYKDIETVTVKNQCTKK